MILTFTLNGRDISLESSPTMRLVDLLQNELSVEGLHPTCYNGECGNCAVLFNGKLVYSCLLPAFAAEGAFIHTYEGIRRSTGYQDIIRGLEEADARPCEFCLPSKVLIVQSILENSLDPGTELIFEALSGTYCPCTNFNRMVQGVRNAAELRRIRLAET